MLYSTAEPKSFTGRLLTHTVRSVTVVAMAAYTGNMAAILTARQLTHSASDGNHAPLLLRDVIASAAGDVTLRFGTVRNSDVSDLLEQSTTPLHRRAWLTMTSSNDMADDIDDALFRVRSDTNYVLLWHRPGLLHRVRTAASGGMPSANCAAATSLLVELGAEDQEDGSGAVLNYGVAVAVNSRRLTTGYRQVVDVLNRALIQLHQRNYFRALDNKSVRAVNSGWLRMLCSV